MDRPIIVPIRRMDKRNPVQLPGFITSDNLFGSSPLFLKQFQNHNGAIDSLGLEEHKADQIPVIKPRQSISQQYINYGCKFTGPVALPQVYPVPRTQRTIFFRNEDLLIVEDPVGLEPTPVPKPRPRPLSMSPHINTESSSWVHVDEIAKEVGENNCGNSSFDRSGGQYCTGSKKRKNPQDDQYDSYGGYYNFGSRYENGSRSQKKPKHENNSICSIL